ncbi:MAG: DUF2228 domain-containing protein [Nannocystaceae bacterium]|nr:DUF2228 domain-containing protein [Myxococcales bacterium]
MTPEDIDAARSLASARWEEWFPIEQPDATLASWDPPLYVRGLGLVASFHLYAPTTYKGPHAQLVVVPAARIDAAADALDELKATLDRARAAGLVAAFGDDLKDTLKLAAAEPRPGLFAPDEATVARRAAALAEMEARFDAVAARMREVYGLRLPRYMATFAALWRSLDDVERKGAERLGRGPGGIMLWFEDDGLARRTLRDLDPRLECRFRCDPPELVTVMWGDSDGLHYGLWYDDPADPPTCVAHNYARDSAETWRDEPPTPLAVLAALAHERLHDPYNDEPPSLWVYAFAEAVAWFSDADAAALALDPPAARWRSAPRIPTIGTFGPALPEGAGSLRVGDPHARLKVYREQPQRARAWIAAALRDCALGQPAAALTFGLDLHWLDRDDTRADALELLVCAYEALGRRAHAETIKVHYAHRDLASVGVYAPPESPEPPE